LLYKQNSGLLINLTTFATLKHFHAQSKNLPLRSIEVWFLNGFNGKSAVG